MVEDLIFPLVTSQCDLIQMRKLHKMIGREIEKKEGNVKTKTRIVNEELKRVIIKHINKKNENA